MDINIGVRKMVTVLVLLFCVLQSTFVPSLGRAYNLKGIKKFARLLAQTAPETGILIFDARSGQEIYSRSKNKPFVPASVAKLVTSYVALKFLGPDYEFRTKVFYTGALRNGLLNGDLYIKGFGDPFLVDEKLWLFAQQIRSLGLREVGGDLVIDGSYFCPQVSRIIIDNHIHRPYNAVLSAFAVDFNTVTFMFRCASGKSWSSYRPISPYVEVHNRVQVTSGCKYPSLRAESVMSGEPRTEVFTVRGKVRCVKNPVEVRTNVREPLFFSGWSLYEQLKDVGINLHGRVRLGESPEGAKVLYVYHSPPLREILYGLNRYSNNFMAEMLLRVVGGEILGGPATLAKGLKVIKKELDALGIRPSEYVLVNGSGLSHEMRVSPRVVGKILFRAYHDFAVSAEFLCSLATPGTMGTLRDRIRRDKNGNAFLRAKTGSLDGVVSLAGYARDNGGHDIGLVILANKVENRIIANKIIDELVRSIWQ